METLKDMVNDLKIHHTNDLDFQIATYLINHYFHNDYFGDECDFLYYLYAPTIWFELNKWIHQNLHNADEKTNINLKEILDNFVLTAKIATYDQRKCIYNHWLRKKERISFKGSITHPNIINNIYCNKVLKSINMRFHELDQIALVKEALGIDVPLKELKKQIKGMKLC